MMEAGGLVWDHESQQRLGLMWKRQKWRKQLDLDAEERQRQQHPPADWRGT